MVLDLALDPFTLAFVLACLSFILSLFLLVLRTAVPRYEGLFRWSIGTAIIGLGFLIGIAGGARYIWLGAVIGNTSVVGGLALISRGSWAFFNRSVPIGRLAFIAPGAVLAIGLWSAFAAPDIGLYFSLSYLMLAVQFGLSAVVLIYRFPFRRRSAPRYTAATYALLSLYFLSESATGLFVSLSGSAAWMLSPRPLLAMTIGVVAWTIGLVLMTTNRLAEELASHEQEAARRERYRMIQTIIDSLPQNVVLKDKRSRYLACNAAFARSIGKDAEAIVGSDDLSHFPAALAEKYRADDLSVMESDDIREFCEQYRENGQDFWVETTKVPVHDEGGAVDGVLVVFHNITERINAERTLQESEQRYRELSADLERRVEERSRELLEARRDIEIYFEVTPDFFCVMDFRGRLQKLSPAWTKQFHQPELDMIGRELTDFLHPDDKAKFKAILPELRAGNKHQDLQTRFSPGGAPWSWLSWTFVGVPEREFLIGAAHDISAQVEAVKRIDLARMEAERASNAKTLFISTMSHELRTPLNAVLGYSALLENLAKDEKAISYLKCIGSAGRSLLAIINDLLDLSKAESGRIELQPVPSDPRLLLGELAELFRFATEGKRFIIELNAGKELPANILMDAARVRQVMINLVGNAIKFTEKGFIRVSLDAVPVAGESDRRAEGKSWRSVLRIEVSDTGIGMSEEYVRRLFEAFSQENVAIARRYGGTGLGLAIAKRLLDMMNATIACESVLGEGTRFKIEIPDLVSSGAGNSARIVIGQDG